MNLRIFRRMISSLTAAVIFCLVLLAVATPLFAAEQVEIAIEGVEGDALKNVQAALALPEGIVTDGRVNTLWLDYFRLKAVEKIRNALEPFGYYSPDIVIDLETPEKERYRLLARIKPGPPVRISAVNISVQGPGADTTSFRELVSKFPLKKGDVLLHGEYERAKGELKALALETGYLDADFPIHRILVNREEKTATIELLLTTGPQYRFGATSFEGAALYPQRFLKRYLAYKPGEVLASAKLRQTQLNLMNSERFSEVIPVTEIEKAENLQVPVTITIKPGFSRRLRTGVGYGTDTGARFSINYSDLNSLSRGYELRSEMNIAERLQGIGITYLIPSYKDLNSFTEFKSNMQHEETDTYETRIFALETNRTRSFGKGRSGSVYLRILYEDSTIASQTDRAFLVLPGIRFSANRYDNLIRPTSGYLYSAEVRGTHEYLGSDTDMLQVILQGSVIVPLPWRLSLYSRIKGAATAQNDSLRQIPASLRFFAGGDRSVRGYEYQSLGPRNEEGEVVGGKHLLVGSIELERALFSDWGVAAFYDAGNSFNSFSDIQLYQGAGVGIRYYTQIGAIKVDIARQIAMENPKFRIHFSIGIEL